MDEPTVISRAAALLEVGQPQAALDLAMPLLSSGTWQAEASAITAAALIGLGRLEAALELARQSLALAPEEAEAQLLLVICLRALGRSREAATTAQAAVARHPEHFDLLLEAAQATHDAGQPEVARHLAREAARVAPDEALAHFVVGYTHEELPGPTALHAYRKTLELDPQHDGAAYNLAMLEAGEDDLPGGRMAAAVKHLSDHPLSGLARTEVVRLALLPLMLLSLSFPILPVGVWLWLKLLRHGPRAGAPVDLGPLTAPKWLLALTVLATVTAGIWVFVAIKAWISVRKPIRPLGGARWLWPIGRRYPGSLAAGIVVLAAASAWLGLGVMTLLGHSPQRLGYCSVVGFSLAATVMIWLDHWLLLRREARQALQ